MFLNKYLIMRTGVRKGDRDRSALRGSENQTLRLILERVCDPKIRDPLVTTLRELIRAQRTIVSIRADALAEIFAFCARLTPLTQTHLVTDMFKASSLGDFDSVLFVPNFPHCALLACSTDPERSDLMRRVHSALSALRDHALQVGDAGLDVFTVDGMNIWFGQQGQPDQARRIYCVLSNGPKLVFDLSDQIDPNSPTASILAKSYGRLENFSLGFSVFDPTASSPIPPAEDDCLWKMDEFPRAPEGTCTKKYQLFIETGCRRSYSGPSDHEVDGASLSFESTYVVSARLSAKLEYERPYLFGTKTSGVISIRMCLPPELKRGTLSARQFLAFGRIFEGEGSSLILVDIGGNDSFSKTLESNPR
jgi:hypothetical protein